MGKSTRKLTYNQLLALVSKQEGIIAKLDARIAELERQLKINSHNSSKPPSTDAPNLPKKTAAKRRKKRGAQKGHEPHLKALLPPEQVTQFIEMEPDACPNCAGKHFADSGELPLRDQFIDLPPITIAVTEYLRPQLKCLRCGTHTYAPLPEDVSKSCFGSGVLSMVGILTGVLNVSKRKALMIMNEVFSVPMSLGGLSNCEKQIADALRAPYDEVAGHLREQAVAHADETSWRRGNLVKGWLWTLCCSTAAVFLIHAKRGQVAAQKLLDGFSGILVIDRWGGYNSYAGRRQICWAHLLRDFQAISESTDEELGVIGDILHELAGKILHLRCRVRDGTLQWRTFQSRLPALIAEVEEFLEIGAAYEGALAGKCREIYKCREHLWTFVECEEVPPTNNHAERMVRPGVMWRKTSFGTQSERGARYVERVLTVNASCRLQQRSVIEFLREATRCHTQNRPAPALIR